MTTSMLLTKFLSTVALTLIMGNMVMAQSPYPPLPQPGKSAQKPNPFEKKDAPKPSEIQDRGPRKGTDLLADLVLTAADRSILLIRKETKRNSGAQEPAAKPSDPFEYRLAVRVDDVWVTSAVNGQGQPRLSDAGSGREYYRQIKHDDADFREFYGSTSWTDGSTGIMEGLPEEDGLKASGEDGPSEGYLLLFHLNDRMPATGGPQVVSTSVKISPEQYRAGTLTSPELRSLEKGLVGGIFLTRGSTGSGREVGQIGFQFSGFLHVDKGTFRIVRPSLTVPVEDIPEPIVKSESPKTENAKTPKPTKPSKPQTKRERRGKRSR